MTNKHTPGPWASKHTHSGNHEYIRHIMAGNDMVADVLDLEGQLAESVANALLIAAAPDLLAALEDAEFLLRKAGQLRGPMQDSFNRGASDARATIAKAKGK